MTEATEKGEVGDRTGWGQELGRKTQALGVGEQLVSIFIGVNLGMD